MQINKRAGDVVLPGKSWHWALGILFALFALIAYAVTTAPGMEQQTPVQEKQESIYADEFQKTWQDNADFMVKENDLVGLRAWAQSLNISVLEFASAATLREEIRRASSDFSIYRDKESTERLLVILDVAWNSEK